MSSFEPFEMFTLTSKTTSHDDYNAKPPPHMKTAGLDKCKMAKEVIQNLKPDSKKCTFLEHDRLYSLKLIGRLYVC